MLTVVSMRASITFAAWPRSEIGLYEVHREESLPGFEMGMTLDDFQIAEIRHDVTESLKSAVRTHTGTTLGSQTHHTYSLEDNTRISEQKPTQHKTTP